MINEKQAKDYCCEDISKIYGYKEAIADKEKMWECHHCLGLVWTKEQLIEMGVYYNQPADRLMFVTKSEHKKLHLITSPFTEEHKNNISKALKGKYAEEKHPMYGKHHTEKSKYLNSIHNKGKIPWNKGKHNVYSEKTLNQMRETKKEKYVKEKHPMYGKHHTELTKQKSRESHKCKIVLQFTKNGEFIKEWESLNLAAKTLNISLGGISGCCNGKIKSYKGCIWRFKVDCQ